MDIPQAGDADGILVINVSLCTWTWSSDYEAELKVQSSLNYLNNDMAAQQKEWQHYGEYVLRHEIWFIGSKISCHYDFGILS